MIKGSKLHREQNATCSLVSPCRPCETVIHLVSEAFCILALCVAIVLKSITARCCEYDGPISVYGKLRSVWVQRFASPRDVVSDRPCLALSLRCFRGPNA